MQQLYLLAAGATVYCYASINLAVIISRPIFYRFRGGGGITAAVGIFLFFAPAEFLISALLAYIMVVIWFKTAECRLG